MLSERNMRILCSNDDGIHADGLASLVKIAQSLSDDVWVVAPSDEQSGASRALTLSQPLRVRKHDDRRFSVSGTPTDCVLMALTKIIDGKKPDLILSCLLYTSPSPRDRQKSRMPSSA